MRLRPALAVLVLAAPLRAAETAFPAGFSPQRKVSTSHFEMYHEAAFAPVGLSGQLEGLHAKLMLDLHDFAAAGGAPIKVFVYADGASYVARTGIPAWSAAFAIVEKNEIHCYESPHLQRILAHEMTHLLFTPYFKDAKDPPAWLNEGVAKVMEFSYGQEGDTARMDRHVFSRGRATPLDKLFAFDYHHSPGSSPDQIGLWYQQSASVASFLMRSLPRSRFAVFCGALKAGKSEGDALKEAYGFQVPDVAALERLWRQSVGENK